MLSALDRAALQFGLESLETRRMLAVSASVNSSHTLVITGTSHNDTIVVNKISNGKVTVTGVSKQFSTGSSSGKFNKISINAGNGNDLVQINNNVPYSSSTISAAKGKDTVTGGVGNDNIDGDNDNDTLSGGGGGADLLRGDSGMDTANYSDRHDNLTISLDGQANDGANGGDEGDNVQCEEVIAGTGNDTLTGSSSDDFLDGGAGKDSIDGGSGDDDLIGNPGEDTLLGGPGDDLIQAKNNDKDFLSGGSNTGVGSGDLASVDSIDVPAVQANAIAKAKALAALAPTQLPSTLDTTYGDFETGAETGPDLGWDSIDAAAIDSQGRVVFVGSKTSGGGYGEDFAVTRYTADGKLDTGFGYNGEAVIDFPSEGFFSEDFAHGVAIGADDSIVVVGSTVRGTFFTVLSTDQTQFAIAKLDDTGNLDSSFGDGGLQTVSMTTEGGEAFDGIARDVAIQNDGSIVIAGDRVREEQQVTYDPAGEFSPVNNPNNVWSYGFSDTLDGPVTLYDTPKQSNQIDYWTASQKQSTSTLAPDVLHNGSGDTEAPGINDGVLALEPGFYGENSHITFTAPTTGSYDVSGTFDAAINDGNPTADVHVLVNGESQFDDELPGAGYGSDFDVPGLFLSQGDTVDFVVGYGSNGNFDGDSVSLSAEVTRTSAPDDQTFAVTRLDSAGQIDPFFNQSQTFNTIQVGSESQVSSVALQNLPDDFGQQRIVVGGTADGNFVVARFMADGTVDQFFGENGGYTSTSIEFGAQLNDIAVDADNNIFAVGNADIVEPPSGEISELQPHGESLATTNAVLAKFDADGNFIGQVEHSSDATDQGASWNAVSIDAQNRVLVAGTDGQDYIVGRYDGDMSFDSTFASEPVVIDLAPSDSLGSNDRAIAIGQLGDGKIIAAGSSVVEDQFENSHRETSAVRLVGDQEESNAFDIETFIDNDDLKNPGPDVQPHLDNLSDSALLIIQSAPDDNGNVLIHTNNGGGDKITLTTVVAADGTTNIAVTINGITTFYDAATTNSITINTDGGADSIIADSSVKVKLIVAAGEGDDTVTGGGGTNILMGSGGNDKITGGGVADVVIGGAGRDTVNGNSGNDIVIGGPNNDNLSGGSGDDILIPGFTKYDDDVTALSALLAEWSSSDSYTTRINDLHSGSSGGLNDPFFLRATGSDKTVIDDSAKDTLAGNSGRDWFFRKNSGPNKDSITDLVTGGSSKETVDNL